jgi:outer membrane protein OmpA-like peptidoglycan-associated protein
MKKTGIAVFCFGILLISTPLLGERFRWSVENGVSYRINSYISQERFLNGVSLGPVEIRNKAVLHALAVSNTNAAFYKGEYQYFTREVGTQRQSFAKEEVYPTEFWRDAYGKYFVKPAIFMPVIRDVPVFSKDDIRPGGMWQAEGHEVHDYNNYGLTGGYRIPFNARYVYIDDTVIDGKRIARFSITYAINHSIGIDIEKHRQDAISALSRHHIGSAEYNRLREQQERDWALLQQAPHRVIGSCAWLYYWDVDARLPHSYTQDFHFILMLVNGNTLEFKGTSESIFERIEPVKASDIANIVKILQDGNISGVGAGATAGVPAGTGYSGPDFSVRHDERGIVVELEDILFDIDSAHLKPEARAQLAELARRINTSGKFEIRVEGHTDNTGSAGHNQQLSQRRAREVADFLARALDGDSRNISWIGHGMTRPVAGNHTEAGRARNRRVEIILLTNE